MTIQTKTKAGERLASASAGADVFIESNVNSVEEAKSLAERNRGRPSAFVSLALRCDIGSVSRVKTARARAGHAQPAVPFVHAQEERATR